MANYPLRDTLGADNGLQIINEAGHGYVQKPNPIFVHILSKCGWSRVFEHRQCEQQLISLINALADGMLEMTEAIYEETEVYSEDSGYYEHLAAWFCQDKSGINYLMDTDHLYDYAVFPCTLHFSVNMALSMTATDKQIREKLDPYIVFSDCPKRQLPPGVPYLSKSAWVIKGTDLRHKGTRPFIPVYLSKFNKNADKLKTDQDKWLFILKNMGHLKEIPPILNTEFFRPVFEAARFSNLTASEQKGYLDLDIAF